LERSNLQEAHSINLKKEPSYYNINPNQESIGQIKKVTPDFFSKTVVSSQDKFMSSPFVSRTVSNFKGNDQVNLKKTSLNDKRYNSSQLVLS